MFTLLTFTAPAQIVIPVLICTAIIIPMTIMFIYEKQRDHDLENPSHDEHDSHH